MFHPTDMQFAWHDPLQYKCVVTYVYMAWSFATIFMTRM